MERKRPKPRFVARIAAFAACFTLALAPSAVHAAGPAPLLVTGVLRANGAPVSGAVTVELMPNRELRNKVAQGETVPTLRVGTVNVDATGLFEFRLDPKRVPSAYLGHLADDHGKPVASAQVVLTAMNSDRLARWQFTATSPASGTQDWTSTKTHKHQKTSVPDVTLELGTNKSAYHEADNDSSVRTAASTFTANSGTCIMVDEGLAGPWLTTVAALSSYGSGVSGQVAFDASASITIAVGVEYTNQGWGASGSATITNSQGGGFTTPRMGTHTYVQVKVMFKKSGLYCDGFFEGDEYDASYVHSGPYYLPYVVAGTYCCYTPYLAGSEFRRTSGQQGTFSAGVATPLGTLSAQSGWSTSTSVNYQFTANGRMYYSNSTLGLWQSPWLIADGTSTGPSSDVAPPPDGGGSISPPQSLPSSLSLLRNDYNRDGISDIVAVRNDTLYVWYGNGNGGFDYHGTVGNGWTPYAATLTAVGDINGDGVGDLVAVANDYLHRWYGTGGGGFTYGGTYGTGWTTYAANLTGVGDINGDGKADIVSVANDYLHKWYGNGNGGFTYAGNVGAGWTPYAANLTGVGDINGDGKADIVSIANDYLHKWYGNGNGGFTYGGTYGSGWTPYAGTLAGMGDINKDGQGDLLAVSNDYLRRWYGTGTGGVAYQGDYGTGWGQYVPIH